jgi:peptidyl-prolyl cis-trans isomerase C
MKIYSRLILVTAISGLLFSCGKNENIIASVDNNNISQTTFDAYLDLKRVDKSNAKQAQGHLTQYLNREAMAMAIEKANFLSEDKVDAELNEFKKEMLISRYFEQFLKEQVSESAIRNYYAANAEKFESKKAQVAHILIRTNKNMSEIERKAKHTRAHEAYSKLKTGEDFAKIVSEYSEDTISAKKSGELGWINEGAIDPIFSKTVFSQLKTDEISAPFQTSFGFHIVKLLAEPAVVKKPLERVKGDIRFRLRKKVKDEEMMRLMNSVKVTQR